jgi:hypothetical protein
MADSATKSVDEPKKSKPLLYVSNLFGILVGLLCTMAGSAKLAGAMDREIWGTFAPFFGIPGPLMKAGFVFEAIGGICMLLGLAVKSFAKLDESKSNLLETLILMDGVGLTSFFIGAQFLHLMTDGAPTPLILCPIFLLLRLAYNKGVPPAEFKMLFFGFLGFNILGLLVSIGLHFTMGEIPEPLEPQ